METFKNSPVLRIYMLNELPKKQILLYGCDLIRHAITVYGSIGENLKLVENALSAVADYSFLKTDSSLVRTISKEISDKYSDSLRENSQIGFLPGNIEDKISSSIRWGSIGILYMVETLCNGLLSKNMQIIKNIPISHEASSVGLICFKTATAYFLQEDWTKVLRLYDEMYNNGATFHPHYKTSDTVGIAEEIVEKRNFSLMCILADAITDCGCPEEDALLVRDGTGLSNWALYNLITRENKC